MKERIPALFGVIGPFVAYVSVVVSIALSPWFSWRRNALSDLGHSVKSPTAPMFNFGLSLTGFIIAVYAVTVYRKHAKYTSIGLLLSAFLLQLVATFDEVYGSLHFAVSVLFFASLGIVSIIYALERKSYPALMAFFVGLISWVLYWTFPCGGMGIAVPETISSAAVSLLFVSSAIKIFLSTKGGKE